MDVPDLVRERLGDEEITAGVSIGDEDAVCLTPTRTLVYRSEGILSDEQVEEFSHDIERLSVKEGRRKTKFAIEYVGGTETFTVPSDRGDRVLELLLQGVLRQEGVLDRHETIAGVYRFTELTLVVADNRVLKHIGNVVWDDDFESYPFEGLTGLDFERASNATSIALEIDGRPQRVKVPNETAPMVRQTVEEVVFDYYGVDSLEALNAAVGTQGPGDDAGTGTAGSSDDIGFESGIDPLVTQGDDTRPGERPDATEPETDRVEDSAVPSRMDVSPGSSEDDGPDSDTDSRTTADDGPGSRTTAGDQRGDAPDPLDQGSESGSTGSDDDRPRGRSDPGPGEGADPGHGSGRGTGSGPRRGERDATDRSGTASHGSGEGTGTGGAGREPTPDAGRDAGVGPGDGATDDRGDHPGGALPPAEALDYEPASSEDLAAVATQVEELADAVERQNELLKRQHKALKELVAEMRSE